MFFKDTADYKTLIPTEANFTFGNIAMYLTDVDRTIFKKYLGKDLLNELQIAFDAADSFNELTGLKKDLIELLRQSSANFALPKWAPIGQVNIGNGGITINSTAETKTAFQWQIKDIEEHCNQVGYSALEEALEFLQENLNETVFESYKESEEYKENRYLFISSGKEFATYFSGFDSSRVNFYKLRSLIKKVEDFDIKSVILPELFLDLKQKLQSGEVLGANSKTIIDMIKPALANLVVAKGINELSIVIDAKGIMTFDNTGGRETIENKKHSSDTVLSRIAYAANKDGRTYLKELADYLESNKTNYPLFKNSSKYVAPESAANLNSGEFNFYTAL